MAGNGRPEKYHDSVEPYLDEIREMAQTMTERQIASELGISYSSFRKYKDQYSALKNALKKGRKRLIMDLHSALIRRAKGFQYEEKKIIKEDGKIREETYTRTALPDVAAINLALKNYDKETWRNDPAEYELKKKALKLQERKLEQNEW